MEWVSSFRREKVQLGSYYTRKAFGFEWWKVQFSNRHNYPFGVYYGVKREIGLYYDLKVLITK